MRIVYKYLKDLIIKNRRFVVVLIHLMQAGIANYLAFAIRLEAVLLHEYLYQFASYLSVLLLVRLLFCLLSGLYKDLWRYASIGDLIKIVWSATGGSIVFLVLVMYVAQDTTYPRSIYILDWLLFIIISGSSRLFIRVFRDYLHFQSSGKRLLIIGAGDAGEMIVRDMKNNPAYNYKPIGFIDNDPYKAGHSIHGVTIFGAENKANEVIKEHCPDEILIAIPSAGHKTIKRIYDLYKPFNIPLKILPGMRDILNGNVSVSKIRPLSLEDLLQREPVRADIQHIRQYIEGKSVMVTGAGGSIGSELCRQIIKYKPLSLVLFDRYENSLYEIDLELKGRGSKNETEIFPVVGDILDTRSLEYVFSRYKPTAVFHAAAHKHVPMMEHNPIEAVKNNIFGTKNLVDFSVRYNVENFILISTDKAVNPTSVMGATKKVAEYVALSLNGISQLKSTVVRFGNVLGSSGSVVRLFRKQIDEGMPVTVTHPDVRRFFMLIPEAVQLVLSAAALGKGGEIFVLNMGEQVKITDLAENIIRLSGFLPHEDIKIEFTGLRPGEKLYEELFDETEDVYETEHEKLNVVVPRNLLSSRQIDYYMEVFRHIVADNCHECLLPALKSAVKSFKRQEDHLDYLPHFMIKIPSRHKYP
ncbi:MAG: polysaccharide biosynthesis protein [Nitrospirae bacterium]|nr:polysaccharide biosynthesis protein [Nitrospirota bacterium]